MSWRICCFLPKLVFCSFLQSLICLLYNLQGAHFGIPLDDLQAIATRLFKEFPCVKKERLLYFVADGVVVLNEIDHCRNFAFLNWLLETNSYS